MSLISRGILALLATVLLSACASVQSTADFYVPYTTKTYPPRPKDVPIPILGKAPTTPYTPIGRLAFSSYESFKFLRKSMEYNARRVGADAVILKNVKSQMQDRTYFVPGYMDYIPVTNFYTSNKNGNKQTYAYTTYIPNYRPGYWATDRLVLTAIDAEMILFKDKRP